MILQKIQSGSWFIQHILSATRTKKPTRGKIRQGWGPQSQTVGFAGYVTSKDSVGNFYLENAMALHQAFHQLHQRQEQGHHDAADDAAQQNHHDRFEQRHQTCDSGVDFFIVVVCDF